MEVIDIDLKQGKRKRKLVVALIDDEDFSNLDSSLLQGDFDRGLFFLARKERKEEVMEILKGLSND